MFLMAGRKRVEDAVLALGKMNTGFLDVVSKMGICLYEAKVHLMPSLANKA